MKNVIALLVLVISSNILAQDQYNKGMQKAFQFWGEGKMKEASNLFERIAAAEPDNWLPHYYVAQVNTLSAFGIKDAETITPLLEKAREYVEMAKAISPDNPEILVQEAMVNTAWVAFDGATYGMTLSGKNTALYEKALRLGPDNPRVIFSKAEWEMGSARYFGKDVTPYCKDVERSLELFATFKPKSPFHPNWGRDRAEAVLRRCNGQTN
ncbi:MAG: hypothetical protein AAFX53_08995 [Bacteroidota bacterium]